MLTPGQTENELQRLSNKLEAKTDHLASLLSEAAEAEVTYKIAYAKALLTSEGKTVAEREAKALISVEDLLMKRKTTEAIASACLESVRSIRDQLAAMQSLNANVRNQAGLSR
jgi:hypothetical protein